MELQHFPHVESTMSSALMVLSQQQPSSLQAILQSYLIKIPFKLNARSWFRPAGLSRHACCLGTSGCSKRESTTQWEKSVMRDRSEIEDWSGRQTEGMDREVRRANARLRHFRGVAASVMGDAQRVWREIWDELQDQRSHEEILEDKGSCSARMSGSDRGLLLEKLHLLGIRIDYAKRLCEGSIGNESREEGDQGTWQSS